MLDLLPLLQLWILTIQFFECLNVATQTLCASYLGQKDLDNALSVMRRLTFLGVVVGAMAGGLVFALQEPLVRFFTKDVAVIQQVCMAEGQQTCGWYGHITGLV